MNKTMFQFKFNKDKGKFLALVTSMLHKIAFEENFRDRNVMALELNAFIAEYMGVNIKASNEALNAVKESLKVL